MDSFLKSKLMNQNQNMSADINISKFIIRNTFAFRCYQSVLNMMPICKHLVFFLSIAYIYPFRDVGSEKNQQVQDNCSAANSNDGVEKIKNNLIRDRDWVCGRVSLQFPGAPPRKV